MTPSHSGSGWLLHRNGETAGPFDDTVIVGWIRGGMREGMIRWASADPNSPWLPLHSHAPFAQALGGGVAAKKTGLGTKEAVILLVVGVLAIAAYVTFSELGGSSNAAQLVEATLDPTCSRMSEQFVDLSKRGILTDDELKTPPTSAPHFTAVQLRQMPEDFMKECRAWPPEVKTCAEQAQALLDYELCKRSDGECSRNARKPNGLCP